MQYNYVQQRQPRRRRRRAPIFVAAIVAATALYTVTLLCWPLRAVTATTATVDIPMSQSAAAMTWPANGRAAVGLADGTMLAQHGDNTSVPIASITKVITSLVVLEKMPLAVGQDGPMITFTDADVALYNKYIAMDGSVAPLSVGQTMSQHDLMKICLVLSANNYAETMALWAYGSLDAFLTAARSYLDKHGLHETFIADSTGFSPDSKSSTHDLLRLGALALKDPILKDIVGQATVDVPNYGTVRTTNAVLGEHGIIGIKTGNTDEAGNCLLFAAQQTVESEPVTVVGVVLGSPTRAELWQSVRDVIQSAQASFESVPLVQQKIPYATYTTPWGETVRAISTQTQTGTVWPAQPIDQHVTVRMINPDTRGKVGTVTTKVGDRTYTTQLQLDTPLTGPSWHWRLLHPRAVIAS